MKKRVSVSVWWFGLMFAVLILGDVSYFVLEHGISRWVGAAVSIGAWLFIIQSAELVPGDES